MINPGVQKPHCTAPSSINASWILVSSPFFSRPSRVRMFFSFRPDRQINTGVNSLPVYDHCTGAAFSYLASFFYGSESQPVPQHFQKRFSGVHILPQLLFRLPYTAQVLFPFSSSVTSCCHLHCSYQRPSGDFSADLKPEFP